MTSYSVDLTRSLTSMSLRTKATRLTWIMLWSFLSNIPGKLGSTSRIIALRAYGAKIGTYCLLKRRCKVLIPANLELGDFVAIGHSVELYNHSKVTIGSMTVVSQYSYICTGSHDYSHHCFPLVSFPINIGSQCWLAASVMILPGVSIGDGAVIGARSLVTKNMPEWTVCGGHPCKPIRFRKIQKNLI